MRWSHWVRVVQQTPSAMLLVVQLGALLVYPFLENNAASRAAFSILGIVVLGLAVLSVRRSPPPTWVSLLLAAPALVLLLAQVVSDAGWLTPWSAAFEAALYFYAAVGLIRYMVGDPVITVDDLFAIGATFTLVAWAFAYVYTVVQALAPQSFTAAVDPAEPRSWLELLFLSFTTLTSTGLSDVIPIRAFARSVVMLEQLAGVLYIAMVITRLIALSSGRAAARGQSTRRGGPQAPGAATDPQPPPT